MQRSKLFGWVLPAALCASGVAYALVVAAQEGKLVASDPAAGDTLGFSVAVSGDTAVAGAYQKASNTGAAYVFVRTGSTWTQQQKLTASDAATGDLFGTSVAISGDTLVVGARFDDDPGASDAGSAYVFVRNGTVWSEQGKLKASDSGAGDEFGTAVAVAGDTVVVGSPFDNHTAGPDAGSAYVFVRTGTTWSQQQKLIASDAAGGDALGDEVALSGDTALLGAPGGALGAGSAYVFVRSGATWTEQQKLTASDAAIGDAFGLGLSLSGDTALVGAPLNETAYAFERSGAIWTEQGKLTASDGAAGDWFGHAAAVDGDLAVVGAIFDAHPAGPQAGSAYVFARSGGVWSEAKKLTAADATAQDWFGASAGLSGDTAVVGASMYGPPTGSGSAYAFRLLDCAALPSAEVVRLGTPPNPAALLAGQTSGPVIGAVWDPRIDHAIFMPGAVQDFLAAAVAPVNLPTAYGTLLCGPAPFLVVASPGPGLPFQLKIPFKCVNVGLAFCTQGASVSPTASLALTNALDITIGSQ